MRFRRVLLGLVMAVGLALFFILNSRRAQVADEAASSSALPAPAATPSNGSSNTDMLSKQRDAPSVGEKAAIVEKVLRDGSREPLVPPVIHVDIEIDPKRGGWKSHQEPLVPPVIHVEIARPIHREETLANEPLVPPVIHLEAQ